MASAPTGVSQDITSRSTWAAALLVLLGITPTTTNVNNIVAWETAEGGAGPQFGVANNVTNYNPINITLTTGPKGYGYDPGSGTYYAGASPTSGNTPPVASFSDWATGLAATAARLQQPFAANILAALQSNAPLSSFSSAVASSGWGTGNFGAGSDAKATSGGGGGVDTQSGSSYTAPNSGQVDTGSVSYTPSVIPGIPSSPPPRSTPSAIIPSGTSPASSSGACRSPAGPSWSCWSFCSGPCSSFSGW